MSADEARLALAELALTDARRETARVRSEADSLAAALIVTRWGRPRRPVLRLSREAGRVARSGLLLDRWYAAEHGLSSSRAALGHFLAVGVAADLKPNPFFDPGWYRATHLSGASEAPIRHYLRIGAANALAPGPLFDSIGYAALNPDLAQEPDLLAHFITRGAREGRRFLRSRGDP